jgi:predicted permease
MKDTLLQLRHEVATAIGRLRTRRSYTLLAAGMLAVAIASNVAVFTVLTRTLLRPFPFDDTRMAMVYSTHRDATGKQEEFPSGSADYVHWQTASAAVDGLEISRVFAGSITDRGETESVKVASVSGGIFRLFRVAPFFGSDFTPADDRPESAKVILSHAFWRRNFGADREVVGRSIVIDGAPRTVIGVMPDSFEIPLNRADVFVPAGFHLGNMPNPGARAYAVFARLKPGVSAGAASGELQRISRELETKFPLSHKDYSALVKPLRDALYGARRPALLTLFVAVLLVHLLACVNVANLMLAQISDQRATTAVRLAIGAAPGRIVRYRVIEGLLLSAISAIAGLVLGAAAVRGILHSYADPALLAPVSGSGSAIALFVVALTTVTALAVSLLPALREARVPISTLINEGSQRSSSSVARRRARELFLIAEVALAIPLLIGAAVAVKRFRDLRTFDIGFEPDRLMTAQLIMPARYERAARAKFAAELIRRIESSPAVASAAITTCTFRIDGSAGTVIRSEAMADFAFVNFRRITPHFFETMSSPIVAGRAFNDGDIADSPPVAIVSESFARQFWPGESPLGKKLIRQSQAAVALTVIGVARDMRDAGVAEDLGPTMYAPYLQNNNIYVSIVARARGDAAGLRETIKAAVQSIDPSLAPDELIPMRQFVEESLGSHKLQVALLGGFALIALALAATGIFAVTAYSVSQRMPEIGVRMAFGASPAAVVRELVAASGRAVTAGVLLGAALTIAAIRAAPLITDVTPQLDPRSIAFVVAVLLASALLASLIPALRARSARPADLLRRA